MKYIMGTKIGMIQLFDVNGRQLAATVVHCEPNKVLEVKTAARDGRDGVKVGYLSIDEKKVNKAHAGIFKKINSDVKRHIKTFSDVTNLKVGDEIKVENFIKGEYVDVQGVSKGHGFTGAIKR
jgi:large subunit ribosomal protein L3